MVFWQISHIMLNVKVIHRLLSARTVLIVKRTLSVIQTWMYVNWYKKPSIYKYVDDADIIFYNAPCELWSHKVTSNSPVGSCSKTAHKTFAHCVNCLKEIIVISISHTTYANTFISLWFIKCCNYLSISMPNSCLRLIEAFLSTVLKTNSMAFSEFNWESLKCLFHTYEEWGFIWWYCLKFQFPRCRFRLWVKLCFLYIYSGIIFANILNKKHVRN